MLLHCDLVYGSPDVKLSTPFVDMGLVPEAGSTLLQGRQPASRGGGEVGSVGFPEILNFQLPAQGTA